MAFGVDECDLDLCCSESSADFSPASVQSVGLSVEESCLMEYRVFSAEEARSELQWLLQSEERNYCGQSLALSSDCTRRIRLLLVDTLCQAAERMNMSFTTKALAITYFDRYLAIASLQQGTERLATVAMACLSIAAKADEVCLPTHTLMTQLGLFWGLRMHPGDLRNIELMVLSTLGWRIQDVTAASVLDTLICLLGYQHSSTLQTGCYKQMHTIRESSKLLVAKAFRDPQFHRFRPSSLATAAVLLLLDTIGDLQTDIANFQLAIKEMYNQHQAQEVVQCMHILDAAFGIEVIPSLRHCRVEVAAGDGLVRVYQQKDASITATPTSVLHSAQALGCGQKNRTFQAGGYCP